MKMTSQEHTTLQILKDALDKALYIQENPTSDIPEGFVPVEELEKVNDTLSDYKVKYSKIEEDLALLRALEAQGVDNWDGFGEAVASLEEPSDTAKKKTTTKKVAKKAAKKTAKKKAARKPNKIELLNSCIEAAKDAFARGVDRTVVTDFLLDKTQKSQADGAKLSDLDVDQLEELLKYLNEADSES